MQGGHVPPDFGKNIFGAIIRPNSGKNHVKLGNCVNFFGQIS